MNTNYSEHLFLKHFIAARIQTMYLDKVKGLHIDINFFEEYINIIICYDGTMYRLKVSTYYEPKVWSQFNEIPSIEFRLSAIIYHIIKLLCDNVNFSQSYANILLTNSIPSPCLTGIYFSIRTAKTRSFMIKEEYYVTPSTEEHEFNWRMWQQKPEMSSDLISLINDMYSSSLTIN